MLYMKLFERHTLTMHSNNKNCIELVLFLRGTCRFDSNELIRNICPFSNFFHLSDNAVAYRTREFTPRLWWPSIHVMNVSRYHC